MANVQDHYDDLLAEHYTWMLGDDIEQTARAQRALLNQLGIRAGGACWPFDRGRRRGVAPVRRP